MEKNRLCIFCANCHYSGGVCGAGWICNIYPKLFITEKSENRNCRYHKRARIEDKKSENVEAQNESASLKGLGDMVSAYKRPIQIKKQGNQLMLCGVCKKPIGCFLIIERVCGEKSCGHEKCPFRSRMIIDEVREDSL